MSIVRVGLGESADFGDNYDSIFKKKRPAEPTPAEPEPEPVTEKKDESEAKAES